MPVRLPDEEKIAAVLAGAVELAPSLTGLERACAVYRLRDTGLTDDEIAARLLIQPRSVQRIRNRLRITPARVLAPPRAAEAA